MKAELRVFVLLVLVWVQGSPAESPPVAATESTYPRAETSHEEGSTCGPHSGYSPYYLEVIPSGDFEFDQSLGTGQEIDPFGATPHEVVAEMIALAEVGKDDVVYDLGSGDGRIPIAAAKQAGARGVGVELRPELVEKSREAAKEAGVADRVRFLKKDFFEVDLSEATVVMLYLFPRTALRLRPKLLEELKPGSRIVAYDYGIEGWPRDKEQAVEQFIHGTLYYWIVPANVSGSWQGSLPLGSEDNRRLTLQLEQVFQQVRGKAVLGEEEFPLSDVELKADTLTMALKLPGQERLVLVGKVDGDQMQGAVKTSGNGGTSPEETWRAERNPATRASIDPGIPTATD